MPGFRRVKRSAAGPPLVPPSSGSSSTGLYQEGHLWADRPPDAFQRRNAGAVRGRLGAAARALGVHLTVKRAGDRVFFWR